MIFLGATISCTAHYYNDMLLVDLRENCQREWCMCLFESIHAALQGMLAKRDSAIGGGQLQLLSKQRQSAVRRRQRTNRMLIGMVLAFAASYTPYIGRKMISRAFFVVSNDNWIDERGIIL